MYDENSMDSTKNDISNGVDGINGAYNASNRINNFYKGHKGLDDLKKIANETTKETAKEFAKNAAKEGVKQATGAGAAAATGGTSKALEVAKKLIDTIKKLAENSSSASESKIFIAIIIAIMFLIMVPIFVSVLTPSSAIHLLADSNMEETGIGTFIKQFFPFFSIDEEVNNEEYEADTDVEECALMNKKLLDKRFRKAYKGAIREAKQYCRENGYSWRKSKNTLKETNSASWKQVYQDVNYGYGIAALNLGMYETEVPDYDSEEYSKLINTCPDNLWYEIEYEDMDDEADAEDEFTPEGDDGIWETILEALEMPYVRITIHYYSLEDIYMISTSSPQEKYITKSIYEFDMTNLQMQKIMRDQFKAILEKFPETYNKLNLDNENMVWNYSDEPTPPEDILSNLPKKTYDDIKEGEYMMLGVPWYKQWEYCGSTWYKYGEGDIHSSGCCLMSLCMIGSYLSNSDFSSPVGKYPNMWSYFCDSSNGYITYNSGGYGYISSSSMLNKFGITYTGKSSTSASSLVDQLKSSQKPIMVHYHPGEYTSGGHFSVVVGYDSDRNVFFTNDPGSSHRSEVSFESMEKNSDYFQTYE